jgi:hypothetical protein
MIFHQSLQNRSQQSLFIQRSLFFEVHYFTPPRAISSDDSPFDKKIIDKVDEKQEKTSKVCQA